MTLRSDILNNIEEDLKKIKVSRGYKHEPVEIKRGLHKWNDFEMKPVVCFTLYRDEADEDSESGDLARWMFLYLYGYADTDGMGNTTVINELSEDVETWLFSTDNRYTDNTLVGNVEIKEGGVSDPVNSFIIECRILYET